MTACGAPLALPSGGGHAPRRRWDPLQRLRKSMISATAFRTLTYNRRMATGRTTIDSLKVQGDGFLGNVGVVLSPDLNCVIGARGTGKTSLLEVIRYALGLERATPRINESLAGLIPAALGPEGQVELNLTTRLGDRITIRRSVNGQHEVVNSDTGAIADVDWPPAGLLDVHIYSQNQLEDVATDPTARLQMLDGFCEYDLVRIRNELRDLDLRLQGNASEITQLVNEIEAASAQAGKLPQAKADFAALDKKYAEVLKKVQGQQKDKDAVAIMAKERQSLSSEDQLLADLLAACERALIEPFPGRMLADKLTASLAEGSLTNLPHEQELRTLRTTLSLSSQRFAALREKMTTELQTIRDLIAVCRATSESALKEKTAAYVQLSRTLGALSAEWKVIATQRDASLSQVSALEAQVASASERLARLTEHRAERGHLLERLDQLRDERFRVRQTAATALNDAIGGTARISVEQSGGVQKYQDLLIDCLRGSNLWYNRLSTDIAATVPPRRLAELARSRDARTLADLISIDLDRASRILGFLADSGNAGRLEALDVEDAVRFELRIGKKYQPSDRLSQGQRCTTVLALLLVDSQSPLLIDQPEDNLDNSYFVESVVNVVARQKASRQFIFVTHNPNLPVLAEADTVLALAAKNETAEKAAQGPWSNKAVKGQILTIMEGGLDAFERRRVAYA